MNNNGLHKKYAFMYMYNLCNFKIYICIIYVEINKMVNYIKV